jgi:hypothetical protein
MEAAQVPDEFEQEKTQFACLFLRAQLQAQSPAEVENAAFAAASLIFPEDTGKALRASRFWPIDPIVVRETARLAREGSDGSDLPGKNEIARRAWIMANDRFLAAKDRLSALRLYGELLGHLKADGSGGEDGGMGSQTPIAPTYTLV